MKVTDLMTKPVAVCGPQESLQTAAKLMWERDCGCVPVVDTQRRVLGMVTDRDICMATSMTGKSPQQLAVSEPMSRSVWSCQPEDSVEKAETVMKEHKVRRLPVVDRERRLVGILSLNDIARRAAHGPHAKAGVSIPDTQVTDVLAAISQPAMARAR